MNPFKSDSVCVSCIQLNSGDNLQANLNRAAELIDKAANAGSRLILLPENFSFMGADEHEKMNVAEPQESSSVLAFLSDQARLHKMTIIGGSVILKHGVQKIRNSCPVFSEDGDLMTCYDKIHLFDAALSDDSYNESDTVEAGSKPEMVTIDPWKVGLSICYDLRFPELYHYYSSHGCNILTVPAAFTVPTGSTHWKTLLRSRAIENQCYLLAAGQHGKHPGGRETWGHSMIIDPWGEIVAQIENGDGIITAELSLDKVNSVRDKLPSLKHRRL